MINLLKATSKNSQYVITVQFLMGFISFFYFLKTENFVYIIYSFAMAYSFMQILHNVGLHKYFSHNSFKTTKFWHIFLCISSPLACAGSPYAYSMSHRAHHIFSDTDKDPHGKNIGFWRTAFFDWNFKRIPISTAKFLNDKWILFSHNYYIGIILFFYFLLLIIDLKFALSYNLCVLFLWAAYLNINYFNHGNNFGYRNFDTKDKSFNNIITGYIIGEWHNNHHQNPQRWNQRIKMWEFDVSAQLIKLIKVNENG